MKKNEKDSIENKRTGGRPESDNPKNCSISLRLTKLEKQELKERLKESNYPKMAQYLHNLIFQGQVKVVYVDKTAETLLIELNKIGVNINQIAHQFNAQKRINFISDDQKILEDFKTFYIKIGELIDTRL